MGSLFTDSIFALFDREEKAFVLRWMRCKICLMQVFFITTNSRTEDKPSWKRVQLQAEVKVGKPREATQ